MDIKNAFAAAVLARSNGKTYVVYLNGHRYAAYATYAIACDVARELRGDVIDGDTGEILFPA